MIFLCGPLRISAISALKGYFSAEIAEIRRAPQRRESNWQGASAGKKIDGAETSKRLRSDLPLI
jgi:hypothetical protein